jgi:hypothetical protein
MMNYVRGNVTYIYSHPWRNEGPFFTLVNAYTRGNGVIECFLAGQLSG